MAAAQADEHPKDLPNQHNNSHKLYNETQKTIYNLYQCVKKHFQAASLLQLELPNVGSIFGSFKCSKLTTLKCFILHTDKVINSLLHSKIPNINTACYIYRFLVISVFRSFARFLLTLKVLVCDK